MGALDPPAINEIGMHEAADARPIHRVYVDGFWMDRTDVTNEQFGSFVRTTGYVTVAERTPRAEDFSGVPRDKLVPGSAVFTPPHHPVPLDDELQWWSYVPGANWRHPLGPGSDIKGKEHYPVVPMRMRWSMHVGQESGCRRKRSGSSPPAVDLLENYTRGAMTFGPRGNFDAITDFCHLVLSRTDGEAESEPAVVPVAKRAER